MDIKVQRRNIFHSIGGNTRTLRDSLVGFFGSVKRRLLWWPQGSYTNDDMKSHPQNLNVTVGASLINDESDLRHSQQWFQKIGWVGNHLR